MSTVWLCLNQSNLFLQTQTETQNSPILPMFSNKISVCPVRDLPQNEKSPCFVLKTQPVVDTGVPQRCTNCYCVCVLHNSERRTCHLSAALDDSHGDGLPSEGVEQRPGVKPALVLQPCATEPRSRFICVRHYNINKANPSTLGFGGTEHLD